LLVPNYPWHRIIRARKRDVGLDAVTRPVDVQAGVFAGRADTRKAGLLPAEATDRRDVAAAIGDPKRLDPVAVFGTWTDRPLHEDRVGGRREGRRLLPRNPRPGLGGIDGRAAGYRRVFRVLVGVDVQRRHGRARSSVAAALAGEDPLSLVGVAGVVEAAREDVVFFEGSPFGVLVPGRPRHRPARPGEVDRRGLAILALVGGERATQGRRAAGAPADGAVAARGPFATGERAHEDLVVGWRRAVGLLLAEDGPRNGRFAGRQGAAHDVGVGGVVAIDADRRVDPGGRVVVHLRPWRQRLKCPRRAGARQRNDRPRQRDP